MKIVQINAVYGEKSTGLVVKDIHKLLLSRGYESYVVCPFKQSIDSGIIAIGNFFERKCHAIYTRMTGKQGMASVLSTKKLIKQLENISPNVIHLHNIHSNFINYSLLLQYTAQRKIPVIVTLHDCWFFTGKCYHFEDIGCERWKTGCGDCPKRYKDIPSYLVDSTQRTFNDRNRLYKKNMLYVVGCSIWISKLAAQSPLFSKAQISYIYNGIDTTIFHPNVENLRKEFGLKNYFVIVTMANKWFDSKNSLVRDEIKKYLQDDGRVIIVGCSEGQIKRNIDNRFIMLGYIRNREYLARIYTTGDVFLNLTFIDNLPTVNMEAASCGIPVVTYDAGGSGELVKNGITGFVVDQLNSSSIKDALAQIKSGKIHREQCRQWALEFFDMNNNYLKYLDLYKKVLINKQRGKKNDEEISNSPKK